LSAANNWKHEFENLPKYNADVSEIKYTVKEDIVENYNTEITGNANDGFKIKNTNVEKIKIPVVKKWIGKELESVTVNLYADGKKIGEAKLSKSNGWKHAFENLPKYDEKTGEEIKYAIDENEILGYTAKITGDQEKGFEITNTQDTPKKPKTPKEPPKTGDDSQIILFSAISLGTVILMIMMLFVRRKQNK
ncbi:MAG: Cna B-type domain-containing protein, partial [[Eubacterium] brachy]|nr:Cna B-type domain-containing protein [[Eubacterium] brachy]